MTSAALSSAPTSALPPTPAGTAGRRGSTQAWPVPAPGTSTSGRSSHGSARPGFLRSVGVELLKMRRLRVLLITVLLVIASVAMSSIDLFSQSKIHSLADPATKPWASLLLAMVLFNALRQPIFVAVLASRQTDIEHSGAGWNLASTSGLTPGALCRVKLASLTLLTREAGRLTRRPVDDDEVRSPITEQMFEEALQTLVVDLLRFGEGRDQRHAHPAEGMLTHSLSFYDQYVGRGNPLTQS